MKPAKRENPKRSIFVRVIVCLIILALAAAGFIGLKSMKKPPVKMGREERSLQVATMFVEKTDVPVILSGFGELRSVREMELSAEVAGRVVEVHPYLESGGIIPQGKLLVRIDDEDYRTDYEIGIERLRILEKDFELAKREFARIKSLYDDSKVGTAAGVEAAEKQLNSSADRLMQLRQSVTKAKIKLDKCRIVAPFDIRVISSFAEVGQYVTPGKLVTRVADDSVLEVEVGFYGKDGVNWLAYSDDRGGTGNWFNSPEKVLCHLEWTEAPGVKFEGYLHRVSTFSPKTRSLKVVVRFEKNKDSGQQHPFPLVAGMFVSVEIPGKLMKSVFRLPRSAVSFENTVYLVRDNRIFTQKVEVLRIQGEYVFVGSGLISGDQVVITRLVSPLEGSKVRVINPGQKKES